MDAEDAGRIQETNQVAGDLEGMIDARVENRLKELHTSFPAIVTEYDPDTQRAHVQPCVRRIWVDDGPRDLPALLDCPVVFPAGGAFVMTFPVAKDDECLVVIAERSIDEWWQEGGTQTPAEYRLHDYSDGFAIVGIASKPRALNPAPATDAVEIRTRDGQLRIRMTDREIDVGATDNEKAANGETLKQLLSDVIDQIKALTVNTAVGPSSPPINTPAFAALQAQLPNILSATVKIQR